MPRNTYPLRYCLGLVPIKTHYYNKELIVPAGKVISQDIIDKYSNIADKFEISLRYTPDLEDRIKKNIQVVREKEAKEKLENLVIEYDEDTIIFEEGDTSKELYILLKGSVDVIVGGKKVARISKEGTYFGEMSILRDQPRSATIKTVEPCKFHIIPGNRLVPTIKAYPEIGFKLASILADRVAETTEKLLEQKLKNDTLIATIEELKREIEKIKSREEKREESKIENVKEETNISNSEEIEKLRHQIQKQEAIIKELFNKCRKEYQSPLFLIEKLIPKIHTQETKRILQDIAKYMETSSSLAQKRVNTTIKIDKLSPYLKNLL